MAGRGLGTLTLDLAVKTGAFVSGLDKAGRELDKRAKDMERRATKFGVALGASLVAGVTAFGYAIKSAIDAADELNDTSKKIGIPPEVLSQLQYAAKLSGVAADQLQGGIVKLIKFQSEAAKGAKENVKVFQTLGIAIKDSAGNLRDPMEVFEDFSDVFANIPDGAEKTALALKVFGKSGAELIPLLNEGKAGIKGYADELDRLGGTVTGETARNADAFNDNLEALKTAFGGLALQVASDLLPDLIELTGEFKNLVTEGDGVSSTAHNIAEGIREIATVARVTAEFIHRLAYEMGELNKVNPTYILGRFLSGNNPQANPFSAPGSGESAGGNAVPLGSGQGRGGHGAASTRFVPSLKGLFSPDAKSGGSEKAKVDEVTAAYERMKAQMAETIALFNQTGEAAKVRYQIEHGELAKLSKERQGELIQLAEKQDQLNTEKIAREEMIRLEEEEAKAAAEHSKQINELLDDLAFETSLTKLSNEEKARAIILRQSLAGATEEEAKQITSAVDSMLAAQKSSGELAGAMDEFRSNFEDTVTDVLTGAKSISEAFKSLADMVVAQIARIIAQQLTTSLFGAPGATGGGSAGGWVSSVLSAFLPAHANGTDFAPGGMSIVGERGPEIVNLNRGDTVTPNHKLGGHTITVQIMGGSNPRETAQQTANEVRRVLAFAGRS